MAVERALEAVGDGDEEAVAGVVPDPVVDELEVVEVEEEDRVRARPVVGRLQGPLEAV